MTAPDGTEEVRLHDLERKGLSRVRVLRPADIERMIQGALAEALVANKREGEDLVQKTRQTLMQRMKEAQEQIAAANRAEAEIDRLKGLNAALEAKVKDAKERLATAEAALADLEAEGKRLEREGAEIAARPPAADASPALAEAEKRAEAAGRRKAQLEAELASLGVKP